MVLLCLYYVLRVYYFSPYYNKDLIVFLSVGTGDSILIKSKNDILLLDGGPSSFSTNSIYKYTENRKPSTYISSHTHSDHISGLVHALESSTFYDLFIPMVFNGTFESQKLKYTYNKGIKSSLVANDVLHVGNFNIKVIWPNSNCVSEDYNYCSLVLLVRHILGQSVLLTSDSPNKAQKLYYHQLNDVDYIKVPHQGSVYSLFPDLLKTVSPSNAIISVGENTYGHPHQKVVDYYNNQGINVYRTDEVGDVVLMFGK